MIRFFSFLSILFILNCLLVTCSFVKRGGSSSREADIVTIGNSEKKDTIIFSIRQDSVLLLNKDFDLSGKVYKLPQGVTIKQDKGVFKNGTLIGNRTKIEAKSAVFDKVTISGTWNVPFISTDLFRDLDYTNSLVDVIGLTDKIVDNDVYIRQGNYVLSVDRENQSCLKLTSNTNIHIDGQIILLPNSYRHYNVINVTGENIHISGNGSIIGDKDKHSESEGEWGMGIRFSKARKTSLSGLEIKDCWGDCIYIGGNSSYINIKKCVLKNGRRQGISITSGKNISIEECDIYDIAGTNPMYAIDIEPNKSNIVDSVFIKRVKTYNCKGGILCTRSTKSNSSIGYMEVTDCNVVGTYEKYSYMFKGVDSVVLERCKGSSKHISFVHVKNVFVKENSITNLNRNQLYTYSKCRNIKER